MSRKDVATGVASTPAVYYVQPEPRPGMVQLYDPAELAEQRLQDAVRIARWRDRQAAIAERDRRIRKRLLIAAAVALPMLLSCGGALGWLTYQALSGAAAGAGKALAGLLAVLVLVAALAAGGHRCVTVVKHRH